MFKAVTGVTPKQYAAEHRRQQVQKGLPGSDTVTEAIQASGYASAAGFYGAKESVLGMRPAVYRAGGKDEVIRFAIAESSLGAVLVATTARGICSISLGDDPQVLSAELRGRFPSAQLSDQDPDFEALVSLVVGLVDAPRKSVVVPLDIRGTVFQQRVWEELMRLRPGQTTNYAELAARIGLPSGARAVAGACAANVLAIVVPCHRVVRRDGALSGYRWGTSRKRKLLEKERDK
jgi:AraC family transcriptional regulator of adaptative response/methylated-DNA-[protein]-cysteine methyltransferase